MELIYCDQDADRPGESCCLILLTDGWHIVANGYLCRMTDEAEGQEVLAAFGNGLTQNPPSIDKV